MPDNPQKTESEGVNTSSDSCVQAPFDLKLTEFTIRAKEILKRTARNVIELSQIAHDVHEAYGYQRYIQWVQADLGLSDRMGEKFLNVHSNFTEKISVDYEIATSALYLLSAPSTPETARQEAIGRAESGEKISNKLAKEIADRHKKELAAKEAEITRLKTKPTPNLDNLIPGLLKKYKGSQITPGTANRLSVLTPDHQQLYLTLLESNAYTENTAKAAMEEKLKALEEAARLAREKDDLLKQINAMDTAGASKLIQEKDREIDLIKQEHRREILEVKKAVGQEASLLHENRFKEQLQDAEENRQRLIRKAKEEHGRAEAAWKAQRCLEQRIKELESQLEVNNPTNVDLAREKDIKVSGRHFLISLNELKKDMITIGGGMDKSIFAVHEILKEASRRLAELKGTHDAIIEV